MSTLTDSDQVDGRRVLLKWARLDELFSAAAPILNASALIVVHNHPSGDPKPTREDIDMTRQLKAAANAQEIALHDHVVIGHGRHASFRSLGQL